MDWDRIDWAALWTPGVPVLETLIRGSLTYFLLFGVLRLIPNRHIGTIGIADLLVVVLLTTAVHNALADNYRNWADGAILVLTITFWSQVFNWLGFHVPWFQRLLRPPALPLVDQGRILYRNLRRELITEDELMSQVRQQGLDNLAQVKAAYMEGDGQISVVAFDRAAQSAAQAARQHKESR